MLTKLIASYAEMTNAAYLDYDHDDVSVEDYEQVEAAIEAIVGGKIEPAWNDDDSECVGITVTSTGVTYAAQN